MTKNNNTAEIVVILDKSGSMQSMRNDTIGSFNRFLADQKELTKNTNLTVLTFSYNTQVVYSGKVANAPDLTTETYAPDGGTALNDAIFQAIMYLRTKAANAAVVCIITDGEENSSKYAATGVIKELIQTSESVNGWKFIYLGANVNAFKVGTNMGIQGVNTFNYDLTKSGLQGAAYAANASTQSYLSSTGNSSATPDVLQKYKSLLGSTNASTGNKIK